MARVFIDDNNLKAIANKTREGNGDPESIKYLPREMPSMIDFAYDTVWYGGHSEGYYEGFELGKQQGYAEGHTAGYSEGYGEAYGLGMEMGEYEEYNRFWDSFQDNGKRTSYRGDFGGSGWNVDTFKPKYAIKFTSLTNAFMFFNYGNAMLDYSNYAHLFDFSGAGGAGSSLFQEAWIDYLDIDLSNITQLTNAFSEAYNAGHKTHITLKVSDKCTSFSGAFSYCTALTDLIFKEGSVIVAAINLQYSPLTAESIVSVVEHLSDTTGKTVTFKQTAIDNADWSKTNYASWEELKATKPNWAFAYK